MIPFKLPNINGSVIAVTGTASTLQSLIRTASSSTTFDVNNLDAIDLVVEGDDIRVAFDGNTPTATEGLKVTGSKSLRNISLDALQLVSTGATSNVSIQIGRTASDESGGGTFSSGGGGGGGGITFDPGTPDGALLKKTSSSTVGQDTQVSAALIVSLQALATFTDNLSAYYEKGVTVNDLTANWTYNRTPDPASQTIVGFGPVAVNLRTISASGLGITDTFTLEIDAVGNDVTYGAPTGNPSSKSITHTWVYPYYYGVGAQGLDGAAIGALTTIIRPKENTTKAFSPSTQVMYFAYLNSYGSLTSILDQNGFETISDWTPRTVSITGLDSTIQTYKVYEFNNITTAVAANYTFKF